MDFVKNLEMTHIVGDERRGGYVICVIITHCVRKSICDSPLYLNTFVTIEKMEPHNCD